MIKDLITRNRSYRRFYQEVSIEREMLRELVDLARLSASAANLQPLRYILSCDPQRNALIFPHLAWARYLQGWSGPGEGKSHRHTSLYSETQRQPGHSAVTMVLLLKAYFWVQPSVVWAAV